MTRDDNNFKRPYGTPRFVFMVFMYQHLLYLKIILLTLISLPGLQKGIKFFGFVIKE